MKQTCLWYTIGGMIDRRCEKTIIDHQVNQVNQVLII
jgi:hypothetical protein